MQDFIPESVESVSELMAPPSPDSSYGFHVPGEEEFAKEPPQLPAQLYLGVLNSRSSEEGSARREAEARRPRPPLHREGLGLAAAGRSRLHSQVPLQVRDLRPLQSHRAIAS